MRPQVGNSADPILLDIFTTGQPVAFDADAFRNDTSLPGIASGGAGSDVMVGGTGIDRYESDEGNDTFFLRDDVAIGGPGKDTATVDRGDKTIGVETVKP